MVVFAVIHRRFSHWCS